MVLTERRHCPAREELLWFLSQARPHRLRSMRSFAEEEIVIPAGPFAGRRFRCDRQPYTGLWFDEVDSGRWSRHVATGPTQSGKSLSCFVIPILYHLFELGETVICGLPDMDMAGDKWREDLLPAIERSRYRNLLPRSGGGSRGGRVESLQFNNGATLKFMSGGGGDKSRAGFTARVVVVTETDGMDRPGLHQPGERQDHPVGSTDAGLRQPQTGLSGMHRQHGTGKDLAGVPAREQEQDRTALPGLQRLGGAGAGASDRVAGSGESGIG